MLKRYIIYELVTRKSTKIYDEKYEQSFSVGNLAKHTIFQMCSDSCVCVCLQSRSSNDWNHELRATLRLDLVQKISS